MTYRKNNLQPRDISESLGKLPPQAVDLEETVLGIMMLEQDSVAPVAQFLKPEHFYVEAHMEIYIAILELVKQGRPIDIKSVRHVLEKAGKIDLVGGAYYLACLTAPVSSSANISHHAAIIFEKWLLRQFIQVASQIHHDAYEDTTDVFELQGKIEQSFRNLSEAVPGGREITMRQLVYEQTMDMQEREFDRDLTGVPSGYIKLDKITHGWQNTDLIIVAARPSMGKTAFMLGCALNAAIDFKTPVGIFEMEMSAKQLGMRAASCVTEFELTKLRKSKFEPLDWVRWNAQTSKLANAPIYIDDSGALTLSELSVKARKMVTQHKIKLLIIDYLQLMKGSGERRGGGSREQEISEISRGLKALAKELNIPIILLSQLNRDVEKRPSKRPMLSDLRDSGSIEQDADIVMFLWRPEYYKIKYDTDNQEYLPGITVIMVEKHRNGALGEPYVRFVPKYTKFYNTDYAYVGQADRETVDVTHTEVDPNNKALPPATDKVNPAAPTDDIPF